MREHGHKYTMDDTLMRFLELGSRLTVRHKQCPNEIQGTVSYQ